MTGSGIAVSIPGDAESSIPVMEPASTPVSMVDPSPAGYWDEGMRVRGGKTFRFPRVAIRMRAPVSQGGQTIAVGLKAAGTNSSGSATNGNLNTVMGAHRSTCPAPPGARRSVPRSRLLTRSCPTSRPGDIAPSTSSPTTYSVGYNEINATVALSSTNGAISGGQMPVTVRADLTLPSGRSFPWGRWEPCPRPWRRGSPAGRVSAHLAVGR